MARAATARAATARAARANRRRAATRAAVDPHAMAHAVHPTVLACFNLLTLAPQVVPWGLMIAAPRATVTRAIVRPWAIPLAMCALHATIDGVGFAQPGALEEAATFARVFDATIPPADWASSDVRGPFEAFNEMLENPDFVGEEWAHVLTWDLFVGRFVWLDALARGTPNLRACLLLINFTGPPGLLAYALSCVMSGKGLPPAPGASAKSVMFLDAPAANAREATDAAREAFAEGGGRADVVVRMCAKDVVFDDISRGLKIEGREALYAKLAADDVADDACGARLVVERLAGGASMAGFTFHRSNEANERGARGTCAVEVNDEGLITKITRATEPILKPAGATARLLKAVAKAPENAAPKTRASDSEPTSASEIVKYLWVDVQGCDDFKEQALKNFSDDIVYEDVNFELPFVGKAQVNEFLDEFDIPGLTFTPLSISDGEDACVFTWEVDLGTESATKVRGVSFYEARAGKISYIRDIPGSASAPVLADVAGAFNPALRVFKPTPSEAELIARAKSAQ